MPVEIFFCYAHKDQPLLSRLITQLAPLRLQGIITIWADIEIDAGTEWEKEIEKHLDTAHIILLLVSPDFMASDYSFNREIELAIKRHDRGEAKVIPIILRPVDWQESKFNKIQALPKGGRPQYHCRSPFHLPESP